MFEKSEMGLELEIQVVFRMPARRKITGFGDATE
jgi:hypothetical protein